MRPSRTWIVGLIAFYALVGLAAVLVARDEARPAADPEPVITDLGRLRPGGWYHDGPQRRYLLGGRWLLRTDVAGHGLAQRWFAQAPTTGWRPIGVPYAWNAHDNSVASMIGAPAWYRKDFVLPARLAGARWLVRFESVNYRATVWLDGRLLGRHTGAHLPFELQLRGVHPGVNRLVVRTDNRLLPTDFPPSGVNPARHVALGGWWNDGGLLAEVYVRPVDRVDIQQVRVSAVPRSPGRPVTAHLAVTLRSYAAVALRVRLTARLGALAVALPATTLRPGATAVLRRARRIAHPRLWSPRHPHLYPLTVRAHVGGREVSRYAVSVGVRSVVVRHGRLLLNGRPLKLLGVGLHEMSPAHGAALTPAEMRRLIARVRALGANAIRVHYPMHPYIYELADRLGLLAWSEVPVYRAIARQLGRPAVRAAAVDLVRRDIAANGNHPSIVVWSVGNELGVPTPGVRAYLAAAAAAAHAADPTRPVGLALVDNPNAPCTTAYRPIDVLGINDYFGWYRGVANRQGLGPYLDALHACYPQHALLVTEFGAEANRPGPPTRKGTYAFQRRFVQYHLGVYATKDWLNGEIYWALEAFRAAPGWAGGNPRPSPPWHEKGLLSAAGVPKPAFYDVRRAFRAAALRGGP